MDNDAADRAETPDAPEVEHVAYDETVVNVNITVRGDLTTNQLRAIAEVGEVLAMNFGHPVIRQNYGAIDLELNISDRVVYEKHDGSTRSEVGRKRYVREGLHKETQPSIELLTNKYGYDDEPF